MYKLQRVVSMPYSGARSDSKCFNSTTNMELLAAISTLTSIYQVFHPKGPKMFA